MRGTFFEGAVRAEWIVYAMGQSSEVLNMENISLNRQRRHLSLQVRPLAENAAADEEDGSLRRRTDFILIDK